jgi:S-adenosylmethionine/arginine decarboxylase-like enzyme
MPIRHHLTADFTGVPTAQLRDTALVGGLVIAAASAAGFGATEPPTVRQGGRGEVAAVLLLDGCHIVVHTFPERALLLLDVLAPAARDSQRALDVFARRLTAPSVRPDARERG